jgi:hypothetical protein
MSNLAGLQAFRNDAGKSALNKLQFNRADAYVDQSRPKRIVVRFSDANVGENRTIKKKKAMTAEKILTKHPLGKSGKNIDKEKYDTLKKAIVSALRKNELTHTELFSSLNKTLKGKFSGNIGWYGETVKLDLEARKMIERTSLKPQKYRLKPT